MAEVGRGRERFEAEPTDAQRAVVVRRLGRHARAPGEQECTTLGRRGELRDRHPPIRAADHAGVAVAQLEIGDAGLEGGRRQVEELAADLAGRLDDGPTVVERRLAARAAAVVRAGVGVLVGDREILRPHPELLGGEDREGHHGAGAVLLGAGHDPAAAVALDPDEGPRRTGRAEPPAGRDPDRLVQTKRTVGLDRADRPFERLGRAVALVALAGRTLVAVADEVAEAELDRVEADSPGQHVVVLLDRPAGLRTGRRADRPGRRPIRVDAEGLDVDVRDPVRPGDHHRRDLAEDRRVARVGAAIEQDPGPPREDRAVLRQARLDVDDHRVGHLVGSEELLAPAEDQADGPAGGAGQGGDMALEMEVALAAEAATEMADGNPDAMLRDLEDLGGLGPGVERDLGARLDRDPVARPVGRHRMRLDRHGMGHVRHVALADDDGRGGEGGRRITLDDGRAARDIAGRGEIRVVGVGVERGMDQRRTRHEGPFDVEHRRQVLVLDLDRGHGCRGLFGGQGSDRRDDLTLEADDVSGEQGPIEDEIERAVATLRHVVLGQDGQHAGQGHRPRGVQPDDPGMDPAGEEKPGVSEARERKVSGETRLAGRLGPTVGPDPRSARGGVGGERGGVGARGGVAGPRIGRGIAHGRLLLLVAFRLGRG